MSLSSEKTLLRQSRLPNLLIEPPAPVLDAHPYFPDLYTFDWSRASFAIAAICSISVALCLVIGVSSAIPPPDSSLESERLPFALAYFHSDPIVLAILATIAAFLGYVTNTVNYGLFSAFLTSYIVFLLFVERPARAGHRASSVLSVRSPVA